MFVHGRKTIELQPEEKRARYNKGIRIVAVAILAALVASMLVYAALHGPGLVVLALPIVQLIPHLMSPVAQAVTSAVFGLLLAIGMVGLYRWCHRKKSWEEDGDILTLVQIGIPAQKPSRFEMTIV